MKTIKVALNDSAVLEQLRTIFLQLDYEVSLIELTQRVADEDFSDTELIILDPNLGETGVAEGLIDTLKSRSATSRIPILLCSNEENDTSIINGLNAGANDFVLFPTTTRSLLHRIKNLLPK